MRAQPRLKAEEEARASRNAQRNAAKKTKDNNQAALLKVEDEAKAKLKAKRDAAKAAAAPQHHIPSQPTRAAPAAVPNTSGGGKAGAQQSQPANRSPGRRKSVSVLPGGGGGGELLGGGFYSKGSTAAPTSAPTSPRAGKAGTAREEPELTPRTNNLFKKVLLLSVC